MRRARAILLVMPLLLAALPAGSSLSQPEQKSETTESVIVTGARAQRIIQNYVRGLAAPARVSGKITRWRDGICPITVGLRPQAVKFLNARLRAVAAKAGAPVNDKPDCVPNIEIVFTTDPQGLMNTVRKERPQLLGYADNQAQIAALATFIGPVQAWYTTQTRDINGETVIDMAHHKGMPQNGVPPDAIVMKSTGLRLGDGLTSDFYHVVVAADPTKLTDYPMGQIADYIALLALSHVDKPNDCQPLASILNLLAPGCKSVPDGLSTADMAYLNGLYRRMNGGLNAGLQRGQIARQIEEDASGQ
jgi:hypothetical protein